MLSAPSPAALGQQRVALSPGCRSANGVGGGCRGSATSAPKVAVEPGRPFAVYFLGHSQGDTAEPDCNFHVTALHIGTSWLTRRTFREWVRLEEEVLTEADARVARLPFASVPTPSKGQFERLQAKLAELLHREACWSTAALQKFLGLCAPAKPSSVRICGIGVTTSATRAAGAGSLAVAPAGEAVLEVHPADLPTAPTGAVQTRQQQLLTTHFETFVREFSSLGAAFLGEGCRGDPPIGSERRLLCPRATPATISIDRLRPGATYELYVRAVNAVGASEGVSLIAPVPEAHAEAVPPVDAAVDAETPVEATPLVEAVPAVVPLFIDAVKAPTEAETLAEAEPTVDDTPVEAAAPAEVEEPAALAQAVSVPAPPLQPIAAPVQASVTIPRVGMVCVAGFDLRTQALSLGRSAAEIEQWTDQAVARWKLTRQAALRMALGTSLEWDVAASKVEGIAAWRRLHDMDLIRVSMQKAQTSGIAVSFPHADRIHEFMRVCPCGFLTTEGWPVTVWHLGTAKPRALEFVTIDEICHWSRHFFEYVDIWLTEASERQSELVGHVQVFDLRDVGLRIVSNAALANALKRALGGGEFYMETAAHIYIVNAGAAFSMIWKLVKPLITPRTASKITVSKTVPPELLASIGTDAVPVLIARLAGQCDAQLPVQTPGL